MHKPETSRSSRHMPQRLTIVAILIACLSATMVFVPAAIAQSAGDAVRLTAKRPDLGVPLHHRCGQTSLTGERLADQSIATIVEVCDTHPNWFFVEQGERAGWLVRRYIDGIHRPAAGDSGTYRIATWNIEHCREGAKRGFPEYMGSEAFEARTDVEYRKLAEVIREQGFRLLILQEIGGSDEPDDDGDIITRSACLDHLVDALQPTEYDYAIGTSGGTQRIAFLYDTSAFHLNWTCEPELDPALRVDGKRLFARQPLLGYFTALHDGQEMNDFIAVGVHLASGQTNTRNHTAAMHRIVQWLEEERGDTLCIPEHERDILIAGDFNSNLFGPSIAAFWSVMEASGWKVLAEDQETYPATRLSGRPPMQRHSRIDYNHHLIRRGRSAGRGDHRA